MAKVMVSIPDELLSRIDARAHARRLTRSGYLQGLAERELALDAGNDRGEVELLLGAPVALGGDAATLIRRDRLGH